MSARSVHLLAAVLIDNILYLGILVKQKVSFFLLYAKIIPLRATYSNKLFDVCKIRTAGVMLQAGHCNFEFLDG